MFGDIEAWFARQAITLLVIIATGIAGGVLGWQAKGKWVAADAAKQETVVRKGDAEDVRTAQDSDARIATQQDRADSGIQRVRDALHHPVARTQPDPAVEHNPRVQPLRDTVGLRGNADTAQMPLTVQAAGDAPFNLCGSGSLSVRDVRLLNLAITGATADSAFPGDAEGEIPSTVTGSAFCDQVLTIIDEYKKLAISHDELVQWVEDKQADQRKRLGIQ